MSALVDELKKHWVHRAAAELTTLQSRLEAVEAERDAARFALKGAETEAGYLAGKVERTQAAAEARVEELQKALALWPRAVRDVFEIELKINRTDPMEAMESALSAADSEVRALSPARTEGGKQ
jgi:hypothetical protein